MQDPLKSRVRNSKLTPSQIWQIITEYESNFLSVASISKKYEISRSTVYKVIKEKEYYLHGRNKKTILTLDEGTENRICILIHKFDNNCKAPYTSGEVLEYIHNKAGIELKPHQVRKLMKDSCNMSFKRVWSRPFSMNWAKINQARINYSATLATKLDSHTVLCNIGECWINRNTRPNYSWGLRSKSIEWKNISLVGRISWIMVIFSNGVWMVLTTQNTINSILFFQFLIVLCNWVEKLDIFQEKEILMILDNWSSHRSHRVQEFMADCRIKLCFIPPYSPHLAPVEQIFRTLKNRLKKNLKNRSVKLSKNEGWQDLYPIFQSIAKKDVQTWFKTLYQNIEDHINQIWLEGYKN